VIRVVSLRKAVIAGLVGAALMEAVSFAASSLGVANVDFIGQISS